MDSVHSSFIRADDILNNFAQKNSKFEDRYTSMLEDINAFNKALEYSDRVEVDRLALGYALLDYFEDIKRLKQFHHLDHVNSTKIVSHTAYWLLRRKPIQVLKPDKDLLYVNERFVLAYILNFLSGEDSGVSILTANRAGLDSFADLLFYFLKYRINSPESLELAIASFFAGQIYQEKDKDLSSSLGNLYNSEGKNIKK